MSERFGSVVHCKNFLVKLIRLFPNPELGFIDVEYFFGFDKYIGTPSPQTMVGITRIFFNLENFSLGTTQTTRD